MPVSGTTTLLPEEETSSDIRASFTAIQQPFYLRPVFPEAQKHFISYHKRRGGHFAIFLSEFFSC